jgi:hypothetical protein
VLTERYPSRKTQVPTVLAEKVRTQATFGASSLESVVFYEDSLFVFSTPLDNTLIARD